MVVAGLVALLHRDAHQIGSKASSHHCAVSFMAAHVDTCNQPRALRCCQCFAGVEQLFEGTLSPSLRPYRAEFHVTGPLPASVLAPTWQTARSRPFSSTED